MDILFLSQWYAPEPDGRVSALAEDLAERGHNVMVITGFPNYPYGKIYSEYKLKWRQWENINNVKILRLPLFPNHSYSLIKRGFNYFSFFCSLFFLAPWFIKKPDIIWSYTPFIALPTIWISKIFKTNYVMEITDIWPDTIIATGMIKKGIILNVLNIFAKLAYKHATAITVQNAGFKPCLIERGVNPEKIFIVENWADESLYHPVIYNMELAQKYGMNDMFNVMFAGNMGLAQGLDNIILAAKLCSKNKKIQFVFVGDGVCLDRIKNMVEKEGLNNVLFVRHKPESEMASFYSIADALLVSLIDNPLFEITLPAKTQSYLACGRPIIIAKKGADAKLLSNYGCALNCEPGNPEALASCVLQIFNMKPEERTLMGENSFKLYMQKYKKDKLVGKMEEALINSTNKI